MSNLAEPLARFLRATPGAHVELALNDRLVVLRETGQEAEDPWPLSGDSSTIAALHALPEADRELLTLLAWDGLSQEEAAVLSKPPSSSF